MMRELDFAKYSHRLGEGLFADKVVLSLSQFARTRKADKDIKRNLGRAQSFLQEVIEGGRSTQDAFRSSQTAASARAFTQVVEASTIQVSSKEEFLRYLDGLQDTLSKTFAGKAVTKEELERVEGFFSRYGQLQFQRSKAMLESV